MNKKLINNKLNLSKFFGYLLLVIILFFISTKIITEYKTVYIHKDQSIERINYLAFFGYSFADKVVSIFASKKPGLEQVRIYLSDKAIKKISTYTPNNEKKWLSADILSKNKLKKIDIKGRGSNPTNWMFNKKSYKVKFPKKDVKNYIREYNYVIPRNPGMLGTYLGYFIAEKSGVLSPEARLVELFVNDRPQGVYIEVEELGEGFLRKNNIMPVDLYEGAGSRSHKIPYLTSNLLTNIALWDKSAYFNKFQESDNRRLSYAFKAMNLAQSDDDQYQIFKEIFDLDSWARYSAYQTIVQSWHNYEDNNLTIIFDHWRGKIIPISSDTIFDDDINETLLDIQLILDNDPTLIDRIYGNKPEFIKKKYYYLNKMIEEGVLNEALIEVERLEKKLIASWSRDENKHQYHIINSIQGNPFSQSDFISEISLIKSKIILINKKIKLMLDSKPVVSSQSEGNKLKININTFLPLENISLNFSNDLSLGNSDLFYDLNANSIIDESDILIPVEYEKGKMTLKTIFISNRSNEAKNNSRVNLFSSFPGVSYAPTTFVLLSEVKLPQIESISVEGLNYSNKKLNVDDYVTPNMNNIPFASNTISESIYLSGNIIVKNDTYYDKPVVIREGTNIILYPNISLFFKQKVTAIGSFEKPIIVKSFNEESWGTFALIGPNTKGSILSNIFINNGSGALTKTTHFTSALSVHDTSNIHINNCKIGNNKLFDDLVHIVYSSSVIIESCIFENANSDAINIDLSEVAMINIVVSNSGNDAIDLMGSNAYIKNSLLEKSNDKGVSVGESSNVLIINTTIDSNIIGIQSKDKSVANVIGGQFSNNNTQFSAYSKNWRYGGGGKIYITGSNIFNAKNDIDIHKGSNLEISNSFADSKIKDNSKRIQIKSMKKNEVVSVHSLSSDEINLMNYWDNNTFSGGFSYVR